MREALRDGLEDEKLIKERLNGQAKANELLYYLMKGVGEKVNLDEDIGAEFVDFDKTSFHLANNHS